MRRILVKAGIGIPRRRRSQQHRVRPRRMTQEEMLVQIDGSHHRWLKEGRLRFALLLSVDDATGTVPAAIDMLGAPARGLGPEDDEPAHTSSILAL